MYPETKGYWDDCVWGDPILCTTWALLTLQKVAPPPTVPVDIKPGSCPNPINVKSRGVIPVAILGTAGFDVSDVDPSTILLSRNGNGGVSPLRWAYADVATPYFPFTGKEDCLDCNELCGDGETDLVLNFDTQEVVGALGEVTDGECLVLKLAGEKNDDTSFEGEDVVLILKKGK